MPTLQDVPQQIKNTFGSVQTTQKIRRISYRAGLETPNAIPRLLYLLEIKELSVHDFLEALRERMGVSERKAKAIAKALKENILEFERASLYAWGVDITEIDTRDAPELEEFTQDAIPEEKEEVEAEFESPKKEGVFAIPIVVEKTQAKEREEEKKRDIIKVNPALLRMQKDSGQRTEDLELKTQDLEQRTQNRLAENSEDRPFVLFEQKGAEVPKKQGKGFSMPFGFFKGSVPASTGAPRSGEPVRAEVKSAQEAPTPQKPRVVHYSGERTQVTPFAHEEELFEVKDLGQRTENLGQRTSLKVEEPAKSGEVQIKKNPFSFPESEEAVALRQAQGKKDGKPRLEGNTVHL